jgi:long-chain acyl-CoA synthetase
MELVEKDLDRNLIAMSGSAPLADETKEEFEADHLGISQGYGLSEMSPITHANIRGLFDSIARVDTMAKTGGFDRPSIGIPLPDTAIKLVDVDSGEAVPVREVVAEEGEAELCLNGPQRMKGYLDDPGPFDEDGFIPTGDVVKIDEMGRFYVVDRVKNMINVSGLKVYSEEVDEVLFTHDGIHRPATIGAPDPDRPGSEVVIIYVQPDPDYEDDLTEDDVREHLEGKVPKQAMPEEVHIVEEIPLTDVGKTDKQALKERHE